MNYGKPNASAQREQRTGYRILPLLRAYVLYASMDVRESAKLENHLTGAGKYYIHSLSAR